MCLLKVWAHFISADQGKEPKRDLNSRLPENSRIRGHVKIDIVKPLNLQIGSQKASD